MSALSTVEIEYNEAGDTFTTTPFQLLQWKHALSLEAKGMTMSGGRKVSTHLRRLMGLKRSCSVAVLQEWVTDTLDSVNEQLGVSA